MEDLFYEPHIWEYSVKATAAASGYVFHKLKKDKVEGYTSAEIDMYLEGENGFDAGPVDKLYMKYEEWKREKNERSLNNQSPQFAD